MNDASLELHLKSDPAQIAGARRATELFATNHGFSTEAVNNVGLCVNEALANVIRHAYNNRYDRPVELMLRMDGDQLQIDLRDWGHGRPPTVALRKIDEHDPLQPGGLGLPCLKSLLDGIEFLPQPDGMLLRMIKRR